MSNALIKNFSIPDVAVPYIDIFFTENDQKVISGVNSEYFTETDVASFIDEDVTTYLDSAYKRGIVSYVNKQKKEYKLNTFYGFLDVFVVTQKERYHREFTREQRGKIDDWYFAAYVEGLDPDYSKRPTEDVILTLDEALEYVDKDDRQLFWTHCDCKCLLGDCNLPTKVCLSYYQGDNTYSDRQVSEPVSKEQAKQIIKDADKAGLMHTWNPNGFCNCCGDCCYLFRAQEVRQSQRLWPRQNYIISFDAGKCVGCGLCTRRCHFNVMTQDENRKISVDNTRCVGCGICANACPTGALSLIKL